MRPPAPSRRPHFPIGSLISRVALTRARGRRVMATYVRTEFQGRGLELSADHSSCGGRSAATQAATLLARNASRREVRRRILEAQLSRLLRRMNNGSPAAGDARRAAVLVARLERDDLDW